METKEQVLRYCVKTDNIKYKEYKIMKVKQINLVRVGNDCRPASDDAIKDIEKRLKKAKHGDTFVCHHEIQFDIVDLVDDEPPVI